ncbi:MAG: PQQ-dependent sugar dehydrogenase, partial [Wenzhouxiangellaceae bacterium]|nr:PQQ-dependent sugar dehydrogenase [Wenzhouxiangellaceae bacterium]MBS3822294.1 PQQ-dependent sugar dehydrogenase [Wenzhouxiangellaceae bacterium]
MKALLLPLLLLTAAAVPAEVPPDVELVPVPGISGLNAPLGLKHAGDGSGRIFIVEQGGTVRVVDADGTLLPEPFVDAGDRVTFSGERGLLDIAFHPNYAVSGAAGEGKFYLHYSAGSTRPDGTRGGDTIVGEFTDNGNPDE